MNEHHVVLSIVTVAGLGVGVQWLAWRLKMPAIVLLAAVGLIMSEEKDVEIYSSKRSIVPEAGDTIVYFGRARQSHASEIADATVG